MKKLIKNRALRILIRVVLGLLIFISLLLLFIRSPWGQGIIVDRVVSFVEDKTNTEVRIDKLYLTFSGRLSLDGLYLEDQKQDTLVFSKNLKVSLALIPLIKGDEINIRSVEWEGLRAKVIRPGSSEEFNFQFLVDAFATESKDNQVANKPSSDPEIDIGNIQFSDFSISFLDQLQGMEANVQLGQFTLDVNEFDLDKMIFEIGELSLSNTQAEYMIRKSQGSAQSNSENTNDSVLPQFSVEDLSVENVSFKYEDFPGRTSIDALLGSLMLDLPMANLADQDIELNEFVLNDSKLSFIQIGQSNDQNIDSNQNGDALRFEWPDWNINAQTISLGRNQFVLQTANTALQPGVFNPEWINLQQLSLNLEDIAYQPGQANLNLESLSLKERSGLELEEFSLDFMANNQQIEINDLNFESSRNTIKGGFSATYASIDEFLKAPESSEVNFEIDPFNLDLSEAYLFSPKLKKNQYLDSLAQQKLVGSIEASGRLNNLQLVNFDLNWGDETALDLSGNFQNVTNPEKLIADLQSLNFQTSRSDITKFLDESELGIQLPEQVVLKGVARGSWSDLVADIGLNTTLGDIELKGELTQDERMSFQAEISGQKLQLNQLLQNEQLDTLSFTIDAKGGGTELKNLTLDMETNFDQLSFNDYDFSGLKLVSDINSGEGDLNLVFKDENLDLEMKNSIQLDSVSPKFNSQLIVRGADLYELGLTTENIRTAFQLNSSFSGNTSDFNLEASLNDGVAVYQQEAFNFGSFILDANTSQDSLNVTIESRTIDTKIKANKSLNEVISVLQRELEHYLNQPETVSSDSIRNNTALEMDLVVRQTRIVSDVFLQSLERMDSIRFNLNFNEQKDSLFAELNTPFIQYNGSSIDSLNLKLNGKDNRLKFLLEWAGLEAGPVAVDHTLFKGNVKNGLIDSRFSVTTDERTLLSMGSELRLNSDTLQFKIAPDTLIFDAQEWAILDENELVLSSDYLSIKSFELSNQNQKITLSTSLPDHEGNHVGAIFSQFQLSTLTSLLNAEKPLASGVLEGDIVLENPLTSIGITSSLNVSDLAVMEVPLGDLNLEATSSGTDEYNTELSIKGENMDLDLTGDYIASNDAGELTLNMNLARLRMEVIERLSQDAISNSTGNISAAIDISGNTKDPQYSGSFNLDQVSFLVNQLNANFSIDQEQLEIDNAGLYLNEFVITDGDNNAFSLDGEILTENIINPSFDLRLNADNFNIVNSSEEDSDLFYGDLGLDADLEITGDLTVPRVRGNLKVVDGSDLTFIVPESQVELKERDGVVIFVNKEDPDNILTRGGQNENSSLAASLSGYDVETNFSIGENSAFHIIIDESTGDNILVKGTGDFNLSVEPNGRTSLSGKYEVSGGHYEANLFNLVQRRFEISSGSSISWSGDPYDADLDVRAIYDVRTSASPLMAARTSSEGSALESSYQERLPFQVYINVEGQLLQPEISFTLDMPEDERSALSGSVYAQVQQLNGQEQELNKQVFSLLVLNRFFPSSGSDGSSGGPASLALDNVNKVLSSQLNTYSDKVFGSSVDVGFDLNSQSASESSSGQTETQLGITARKQLFSERLIVQVGSEVDVAGTQNSSQGTPIIGNVSLEYLLTEDKRLRLKGFSRNQYEGVIDGQLTVSGIALIFTREFNKFKELWTRQVKEEVEEGGGK